MVVEVVDGEERIRAALPMIEEMVSEGLITLTDLEVIAYRAGEDAG